MPADSKQLKLAHSYAWEVCFSKRREESFVEEWVWDGTRSLVGKDTASIFPRGLVSWVCPLCRRGKDILARLPWLWREVSRSRGHAPTILCKTEPRSDAFENKNLGLSRSCSPGQLLASDPVTDHSSGEHGQGTAGTRGFKHSRSHMVTVAHSFGDFQK